MKNKAAKKAIASYYILSLLLTSPLLIPIWLIKDSIGVIGYFLCFLIYMRIAINFAVRVTVMSSLWKELDAEKYAQIINTKPFWLHYSYKLNLYFAIGDYQAAYNVVSSILVQHKNIQHRIYGHLLLCRICFERGDYEGLKDQIDQIDNYFKYNLNLKLSKQNKETYEIYRAFSGADYVSAKVLLEESIEKYSKKKNCVYFLLIRQYQLAVTKRMNGDVEEATLLFEKIKDNSPKLFLSTLAQKQLDYISGTTEEAPERLEVTKNGFTDLSSKFKSPRLISWVLIVIGCLMIIGGNLLTQPDSPKQKNRDFEYESKIESALRDDYEEYQILGYFSIYADDACTETADSVFLIESNEKIDLHTLYISDEKNGNNLNIEDIRTDKSYVYENVFSKKIEFVITKKKQNIPEKAKYYYEIDGYYFCVINVSDA